MNLADIQRGMTLTGLRADPITVVDIKQHGTAATITVRHQSGALSEQIIDEADAARLRLADNKVQWAFDADSHEFKLAGEATRIRMAGLFDPMLAIETSQIDPLPHQIRAVYEEMLPKPGPLRFLLADDPGAGKTIMAGLYLKELVLRGDVRRALVVAPGGLVEQWQDELAEKFGLEFEILSRALADADVQQNPFARHPFLIARMDQLARSEDWMESLAHSQWDLVIVDEAHRMSASYNRNELKRTKRYELGQLLGRVTRHFLLMTATPHAGKEGDFQLFLALLDPDRFEGQYREGIHSRDTSGIMRRMVKEELLTFDGQPLFPQRVSQTVSYELSDAEMDLYEQVTAYVREEMNRADRLADDGQTARRTTVGFALTVLQRRLASSPEAIYRSLQRRRHRLELRKQELSEWEVSRSGDWSISAGFEDELAYAVAEDFDADEFAAAELETLEDEVLDAATAARTAAELDVEIAVLNDLEQLARQVRSQGQDRKWVELRGLIAQARIDEHGAQREIPNKIIVFTEHKDTLNYLCERISSHLGQDRAVVTIHGGTPRHERHRIKERFANDPHCQVLLATDAAGEGLNLQVAHLMVNYDLPWNPNRLEQRFGRIHRIGQREVCHLWNLVAANTREGQVFERLLSKIEQQRLAYGGKVFDVLGEQAFGERPLRVLLIEAIRYGEQPEVRAKLDEVIDASVSEGMAEVLRERALVTGTIGSDALAHLRAQMDEARARRLQPHFIALFVLEALRACNVRAAEREQGTWEIRHVPALLRDRPSRMGLRSAAIAPSYARITFDPALTEVPGQPRAELIAPGHALMDALVDTVLERYGRALTRGTILVDPADTDTVVSGRLLVALREEIVDGTGAVASQRFSFVSIGPGDEGQNMGTAPYLDFIALPNEADRLRDSLVSEPWWGEDVASVATAWSIQHGLPTHRAEVAERIDAEVGKARILVQQRLLSQANYWHAEAGRLLEAQTAGRKIRISPATATARAQEMEERLARKLVELDQLSDLTVTVPQVAAAALIIPMGAVVQYLQGVGGSDGTGVEPGLDDAVSQFGVDEGSQAVRELTDRRAVDAVLRAERALGRTPTEMPHNNPGFDVLSVLPDGSTLRIEVKGRQVGADTFMVSANEIITGQNAAPSYRLALVEVDHDQPAGEEPVRYVADPFAGMVVKSYLSTAVQFKWGPMWGQGRSPF